MPFHYTWNSKLFEGGLKLFQNVYYIFDLAIQFLGIYPEKPETLIQKDIHTPMFTPVLYTIAKIWNSPDDWIKKLWYIYTTEYYEAIKKKETLPFVTAWMDLKIIMLSETSQSEKEK